MSNKINATIKSSVGLANDSTVELDPSETVRQALERIAASQAQDPNSVSLMHNGRILDENSLIRDCSIKNADVLHVTPKNPIGGIIPKILKRRGFTPSPIFKERVSNEAKKIWMDKITFFPETPDFWRGTIIGSGRWNGKYAFTTQLPEKYPYVKPIVRWETPLVPRHPNIEPNSGRPEGDICLNILSYDWRPQYTLITVYKSLQWLLANPRYHEWDNPPVDNKILDSTSIDSILNKIFGRTKYHI